MGKNKDETKEEEEEGSSNPGDDYYARKSVDIVRKSGELERPNLDMKACTLETVPEEVFTLTHLTTLKLHSNQLTGLPDDIANLTNLTSVDLSSNRLRDIPAPLTKLPNLEMLDFNNNHDLGVTWNPSVMKEFNNRIKSINLFMTGVKEIPDDWKELTALEQVNLRRNALTSFPGPLLSMANLLKLDLSNNQIQSLPADFGTVFVNIREVYLAGCSLTEIPESLFFLKNVRTLDLGYNELSDLPEMSGSAALQVKPLPALKSLSLPYNNLSKIPKLLMRFPKITFLDIRGNPIAAKKKITLKANCSVKSTLQLSAPDKIDSNLYLGSWGAAQDKHLLLKLGVKHILTVAHDLPPLYPTRFKYTVISIKDLNTEDMTPFFPKLVETIEKGVVAGGILVHCAAGVSRSASAVVAYLMKKKKIPYSVALHAVRDKRRIAQPNKGFEQQLKQFQQQLGIDDSKRDCLIQ